MNMSGTNSRTLDECGHTFHKGCIDRWKRRNSTCPICRTPFDVPKYKVRLTIEPDGVELSNTTSNISGIVDMFGLDMQHIETFFTDIRFEVMNEENLLEILREIGFPSYDLSRSDAVGTAEF